jgi:hypothetical protein
MGCTICTSSLIAIKNNRLIALKKAKRLSSLLFSGFKYVKGNAAGLNPGKMN